MDVGSKLEYLSLTLSFSTTDRSVTVSQAHYWKKVCTKFGLLKQYLCGYDLWITLTYIPILHGLHVMDHFLSDIKLYYFYVRLLYQVVLLYTVVISLLGLGLCTIHYDYPNYWIRLLYKVVLLNFMVHLWKSVLLSLHYGLLLFNTSNYGL